MNAELQKPASPSVGLAPVYAQYPIEVVGADGVWLHTRDGRKVLDLYGGHDFDGVLRVDRRESVRGRGGFLEFSVHGIRSSLQPAR